MSSIHHGYFELIHTANISERKSAWINNFYTNYPSVLLRESILYFLSVLKSSGIEESQGLKSLEIRIPTKDLPNFTIRGAAAKIEEPRVLAKHLNKIQYLTSHDYFHCKDNYGYFFRVLADHPLVEFKFYAESKKYTLVLKSNLYSRRSELYLKDIEDSSLSVGLELTVPNLDFDAREQMQSEWIRQSKYWDRTCGLDSNIKSSWSLTMEGGREAILKRYGLELKDSKVKFIDVYTERLIQCGGIVFPYKCVALDRKEDFPHIYIGEHLNCLIKLPISAGLTDLTGSAIFPSKKLYSQIENILKDCLIRIHSQIKVITESKKSLVEATLVTIEILRTIYSESKYISRFLERFQTRWKTKYLIQLSYIDKIYRKIKDKGARDIEIEFYGLGKTGSYLDCEKIEYLFIDKNYIYDEETLVGWFGTDCQIVVFSFIQPDLKYTDWKFETIKPDTSALFLTLNILMGEDLGLREYLPESKLSDCLTVKEVYTPKSSPYKNITLKYLRQVSLDATHGTHILIREKDIGQRHYHSLDHESIFPKYTIQELLEFKKLFSWKFYVVQESDSEYFYSFIWLENKLAEHCYKLYLKNSEYAKIFNALAVLKIFRSYGLDINSFISVCQSYYCRIAFEETLRRLDFPSAAVLKSLYLGTQHYLNWKLWKDPSTASLFRIALHSSYKPIEGLNSLALSSITDVEAVLKRKPMLIEFLSTNKPSVIEYIQEYLRT